LQKKSWQQRQNRGIETLSCRKSLGSKGKMEAVRFYHAEKSLGGKAK